MLGHFVADLRYKRVYVTSVEALMQAPVWEKARTLRPVHAAEIFEAKKLEAEKIEIQMIEAGKIEAKGDAEKQVCVFLSVFACVCACVVLCYGSLAWSTRLTGLRGSSSADLEGLLQDARGFVPKTSGHL